MNYIGKEPAPSGVIIVGDTNPVGSVIWGHKVPDGSYLAMNGQIVSKVTYADLWVYAQGFLTADQVLNPGLYRSIDANTFAVPNLAGLFIRATGQYDVNRVAAALGVLQNDDIKAHTHGYRQVGGSGAQVGGTGVNFLNDTPTTLGPTGLETRPVNVALVPCVKALSTVLVPSVVLPALGISGPITAPSVAGTSIDFLLPFAGAKRIVVGFKGVSTNGASIIMVQLGGAAIEAVGYESNAAGMNNAGGIGTVAANALTGMIISSSNGAAFVWNGAMVLSLLNAVNNTWDGAGMYHRSDAAIVGWSSGAKALASGIQRVRVTTVNGVDLFDAGELSVSAQQ